jgi:hypothetical protein
VLCKSFVDTNVMSSMETAGGICAATKPRCDHTCRFTWRQAGQTNKVEALLGQKGKKKKKDERIPESASATAATMAPGINTARNAASTAAVTRGFEIFVFLPSFLPFFLPSSFVTRLGTWWCQLEACD